MASKEKQIEEMAKDMCEYYYEGTCYQDKKPCDCKCEIFTDAQYLYSKGYRKAPDVAREIFEEIDKVLNFYKKYNPYNNLLKSVINRIDELKKKYESEKDNG